MFDTGSMIIGGVIMLFSWLVSNRLKSKFEHYSKLTLRNGMSGAEIAEKMLADHGIRDVKVISTSGRLTDHYNPTDKTVNLSEAVYNQRNAAAVMISKYVGRIPDMPSAFATAATASAKSYSSTASPLT